MKRSRTKFWRITDAGQALSGARALRAVVCIVWGLLLWPFAAVGWLITGRWLCEVTTIEWGGGNER